MTVQTCGRSKRVCKDWNMVLTSKVYDYCTTLRPYQALFTPMFKRFVIAVGQIDTTASPKFCLDSQNGLLQPETQGEYEARMFYSAFGYAEDDYDFSLSSGKEPNSFFERTTDKSPFLNAVDILCQSYYQSTLPKITVFDRNHNGNTVARFEFAIFTIKELLEKLEELKDFEGAADAFEILKSLIIKYNLLPLEEGNPVLATSKRSKLAAVLDVLFWVFLLLVVCNVLLYLV